MTNVIIKDKTIFYFYVRNYKEFNTYNYENPTYFKQTN